MAVALLPSSSPLHLLLLTPSNSPCPPPHSSRISISSSSSYTTQKFITIRASGFPIARTPKLKCYAAKQTGEGIISESEEDEVVSCDGAVRLNHVEETGSDSSGIAADSSNDYVSLGIREPVYEVWSLICLYGSR